MHCQPDNEMGVLTLQSHSSSLFDNINCWSGVHVLLLVFVARITIVNIEMSLTTFSILVICEILEVTKLGNRLIDITTTKF
jgi:hypothetical protein